MNTTFFPSSDYEKKKWYIIDCKEKQLGRLASSVVSILSGKIKSYYHPSLDLGDYVILINSKDIIVSSTIEKFHVFKPGRPGRSLKKLVSPSSYQILERCIFGMMPNCMAKRHLSKRLKIYQGMSHPHLSQNPKQINDLNMIYKIL